MKGFLQRILQEIMKKNNTWNIRRLVDDLFVPSSQQPRILYCKLTDFKSTKNWSSNLAIPKWWNYGSFLYFFWLHYGYFYQNNRCNSVCSRNALTWKNFLSLQCHTESGGRTQRWFSKLWAIFGFVREKAERRSSKSEGCEVL